MEGLVVLLASLYFYQVIEGDWWVFALLLLTPDISMVGYIKDKRLGAFTYNLVHNYIFALLLIIIGILLSPLFLTQLGLILTSHIGLDRLMGFGLKYPYKFKETHMQKV
jgi:hypothetical protein